VYSCCFDVQLLAGVERASVDLFVELRPDVLQPAVVSEGSPLGVHTHPALVSLHQVDVTQLLHVARVGART